ncbi:MAG: hypothetical protein JWM99_587 [Verrucomicrobiales bacterium]|nr:hypothetical protein [Verrucomicrobiales bacterium]
MNDKRIKIANQTAAQTVPFVVLQDSWVQLSPYGDFPHGKGLQRVDRNAADTLASSFHSFSGKLGRRFAGAPFYVGHPDVPGFPKKKMKNSGIDYDRAWQQIKIENPQLFAFPQS